MPPRSKQTKLEWGKCSSCQCIFSSKEHSNHMKLCLKNQNVPHENMTHGFILEKILYGKHVELNASSSHLPGGILDCSIHVHPSAMKQCGMYIGGPVIEKSSGMVYLVWPQISLPLTAVAITETQLNRTKLQHNLFVIEALDYPHIAAQDVWIRLMSDDEHFTITEDCLLYVKKYLEERFVFRSHIISLVYFGKPLKFEITKINAETEELSTNQETSQEEDVSDGIENLTLQQTSDKIEYYKVTYHTKIRNSESSKSEVDDNIHKGDLDVSFTDIGGLQSEIQLLKEMVDFQLLNNIETQSAKSAGIQFPKGLLLHGLPGTGKSMLLQATARYANVHTTVIHGPNIWSKFYGDSEQKLKKLFQEAEEKSPSIILLDEVDSLCPKRQSSKNEVERRVLSTLLLLLDHLFKSDSDVLILASTSKLENVDLALRRPGRLDREQEICVPNTLERRQILRKHMARITHSLTDKDIDIIADKAHGYVGADIASLCREAGMDAIRKSLGKQQLVQMSMENMSAGLNVVRPSAMREILLEIPEVSWDDIGGQDELKRKLKEAIELPLKHPEAFKRLNIKPPRGLLMYGPPGCSKTMIGQALAHDSGLNFISIKGPELFNKWVGESEKALRKVFSRARAAAPSIIFFDEIDSIATERGSGSGGSNNVADRILAQLLTEMDGVEALCNVTIVAATNRPDKIDKALMRPGRLDRIIYVPLPDEVTRREIFNIHFRKTPVSKDVCLDSLVLATEGCSGVEVASLVMEASMAAFSEDITTAQVHSRHFESALRNIARRTTKETITFYEDFNKSCGFEALQ